MFLIYNILSLILLIVYSPILMLKKGPEKRLIYFKERIGLSEYANADIWVHAVSVGEVIAVVPFLKAIKREFPKLKIVLSTTTYTGQKIAHERFPLADRIMYMPWDTWLCVRNAVRTIKPRIFLTIETELWPSLFAALKKADVYIAVLNGRISLKSFRGYKWIGFFIKRVLSLVDFFYMQGEADAERIISIGADRKNVGIMGNFKFDIDLGEKETPGWMDMIKGNIFLAGSTHKGEEDIILDAYELINKDRGQKLKLILAPRHPERFDEVEDILKKRGFNYIRRSEIRIQNTEQRAQNTDIILLDTIGELSMLYSKATLSFIGGSLIPFGGHNILEPAYWGKPVLFGPHMENFPFVREFLEKDAAIMVKDSEEIASIVKDLLANSSRLQQIGLRGKTIIENNRGAVAKAIEIVRGFLGYS